MSDLRHHGIKGQKWGVRRFQNKDGSLTPAGAKRYSADDYKSALDKVNKADKTLKDVKKMRNEAEAKTYEKKIIYDLSKMSDKDLQQAVNRLNMEERYTQVMAQRHRLEQGEDKVNKILNVAGSALTGAATALTIAAAMKELMDKK